MKNPEVFIRFKCARCKGVGTIQNPRRKKFPKAARRITCIKCTGTGYIEKWIPLEDLESEEIVSLTERLDALEKKFPFAPRLKKVGR